MLLCIGITLLLFTNYETIKMKKLRNNQWKYDSYKSSKEDLDGPHRKLENNLSIDELAKGCNIVYINGTTKIVGLSDKLSVTDEKFGRSNRGEKTLDQKNLSPKSL